MLFQDSNLLLGVVLHLHAHVLASVEDILIPSINLHLALYLFGPSLPTDAILLQNSPIFGHFLNLNMCLF